MIKELIANFEVLFADDFAHNHFIRVNNQTTLELYNQQYYLNVNTIQEFLKKDYKANFVADIVERKEIIEYFVDRVENIKKDIHSRQIVYQPKYQENNKLAACLSCIMLIIRDNKIDIHVFVRSQNFNTNFLYDNLTYCLLMLEMHKRFEVLKMGNVYVKIVSLHKII